jgi:hypothetical protein
MARIDARPSLLQLARWRADAVWTGGGTSPAGVRRAVGRALNAISLQADVSPAAGFAELIAGGVVRWRAASVLSGGERQL